MSEWEGPSGPIEAACAIHAERTAVAACSRCGTFSCQECLSQTPEGSLPLCPACVARVSVSQLPWDYREELGWVRAWIKSMGAILLRPGVTFSTAKPEGDVGGSLLFSFVAWLVALVPSFVVFALIGALIPSFFGSSGDSPKFRAVLLGSFGVMFLAMVLLAVFGMISTIIMAALDHLVLLMFGKPKGFDTTLRGAALSMAPYVLGLIPICGLYVAPVWALIARIFAYKGMHRMSAGMAVLGALAVPILFTVLGCGLYLVGMAAVMAAGAK
jgi:hypothetical protein